MKILAFILPQFICGSCGNTLYCSKVHQARDPGFEAPVGAFVVALCLNLDCSRWKIEAKLPLPGIVETPAEEVPLSENASKGNRHASS